jgi:hypothetical protein
MIRKFLLIGDSGLLQYYINQDKIQIDADLLSGFAKALYEVSRELTFKLKTVGFEKNKMIVEDIKHSEAKTFLIATIFDEYHIAEGIKNKIHHIYDNFFKTMDFKDESKNLMTVELNQKISSVLNDNSLKSYVTRNIVSFTSILDPIIFEEENNIHAYCLCSSSNEVILFNGTERLLENRPEESIESIIKEYLVQLKLDEVPQGDKFIGLDLPFGLDYLDHDTSGEKTLGVVINTSINLKEEPNNELLLYFFGKNILIRSCVLNVETHLREQLI